GYLEDPSSRKPVLRGRLDTLEGTARFPPLGALLTGYEEAAYRLLNTHRVDAGASQADLAHLAMPDDATPAAAVQKILDAANRTLDGTVTPSATLKAYNEDAENAFNLLDQVADRTGAEILVQDGKVQFGVAVTSPAESGFPKRPNIPALLALLTAEDSLIAV